MKSRRGERREGRGRRERGDRKRKGGNVRQSAYVPPSHSAPTLVLTPHKREKLLEYNSHQSWTVEHLQHTRSQQRHQTEM